MRIRARRDSNEAAFVDLFKAHGCEVARLSQTDIADLLVSWPSHPPPTNQALRRWTGKLALCEVKSKQGAEPARTRPGQVTFRGRFPTWLVKTDADVREVITWLKS